MSDLTLYGLKTCDTCRKAIKALEAAGHAVSFVDLRAEAVPEPVLRGWLARHGDALINTRSTTWRGLDDGARAKAASDPVSLLSEHPTLIKRPVIDNGGTVTVGWAKPVQAGFGL